MNMTVQRFEDGVTRICLEGRMDLLGTQAIDQKFAFATSTQPLRLAVDLSNVQYIASIGLRTILTAARAQRMRRGKMVLCGADAMALKVLEMAGIDKLVPVFKDWESARTELLKPDLSVNE